MSKIFYDHLIVREEIIRELDKYEIDAVEREEIIQLADETLHHHTLDVILRKLPKEKHQKFLQRFHQNPGDESLLKKLKSEVAEIEKLISEEAKKVKKDILAEIQRSRKKWPQFW